MNATQSPNQSINVERLFEAIISGDRFAARRIIADSVRQGSAETTISDLLWPTHELVEKLHRSDQLTTLAYHLSTRLLRMMVDQTSALLQRRPSIGRTIFAMSGPTHNEELAAQMACDLLEAQGYEVNFAGGFQILGDDTGGIPADEVLNVVQERKPDILLFFSSAARDLPAIRNMIDQIRDNGASASTQVVVGGGVFNRAEGLSEEIGADLCCNDPLELVQVLTDEAMRPLRAKRSVSPAKRAVQAKRAAA